MSLWIWAAFLGLILFLLALDLGVLNRKVHVISVGEAMGWTAFWVALALAFNAGVYFMYETHWGGVGREIGHELGGSQAAFQFLTGYLIEKSLSLDNIFVIALIFVYFRVPLELQHKVLFWGILGALVLRGIMIGAGVLLIRRFDWVVYVFGAFLLLTAVKLLIDRHDNLELDRNPVVRLARRFFPVTEGFHGARFFVRADGRLAMTPLFLALLVVEASDVVFAVDSIPAIFAVTLDPFLIFTSNVFAILGLRSLYFALAAVMESFRYMKMSLVYVLAFVGVKMILSHHYAIPTGASLAVIGGILSIGIVASLVGLKRDTARLASPIANGLQYLLTLTWKRARRTLVLIVGSSLLAVGAALLVLPGPGILLIVFALALLASEYLWAHRWLERIRKSSAELQEELAGFLRKSERD